MFIRNVLLYTYNYLLTTYIYVCVNHFKNIFHFSFRPKIKRLPKIISVSILPLKACFGRSSFKILFDNFFNVFFVYVYKNILKKIKIFNQIGNLVPICDFSLTYGTELSMALCQNQNG